MLFPPKLIKRTPHSYYVDDVPAFEKWLFANGFHQVEQKTMVEYGRYMRSRRLIVLYHSGAVVIGGPSLDPLRALLAELVIEQPMLEQAGAL